MPRKASGRELRTTNGSLPDRRKRSKLPIQATAPYSDEILINFRDTLLTAVLLPVLAVTLMACILACLALLGLAGRNIRASTIKV